MQEGEEVRADPADEFTRKLFKENIQLRANISTIQRQLFAITSQYESAEDEIANLKHKVTSKRYSAHGNRPNNTSRKTETLTSNETGLGEQVDLQSPDSNSAPDSDVLGEEARVTPENVVSSTPGTIDSKAGQRSDSIVPKVGQDSTVKDLKETMFSLKAKEEELKVLQEKYEALQADLQAELSRNETMDAELRALNAHLSEQMVKSKELEKLKAAILNENQSNDTQHDDKHDIRNTEQIQTANAQLRKQIIDVVEDANRIQNEQMSQLQGYELLLGKIKSEYDEFIQVTKLENENFRITQQAEYESLKREYEMHKIQEFEDKKKMMVEYQGLLYSMQTQFEEYRSTSEFLFQTEITKLQDYITSQTARYEEEILYVIQSKDKFYHDIMVFKDSKIMSLIEGADMQSLMQRHELSIENMRNEHSKEIERVKSDQETESKNLIALLHRQNASLESKCDKLQTHMKVLETKIKELMATIESKNKAIESKDEAKLRAETLHNEALDDIAKKLSVIALEKETLRHKVIRLSLEVKGEGENTIQNMLKRVNRETKGLFTEFHELADKHDALVDEHHQTTRKLRERERLVAFLEKEVERRNAEFSTMTKTFEEFLDGRARESRLSTLKKASSIDLLSKRTPSSPSVRTPDGNSSANPVVGKTIVKASIPDADETPKHSATLPSIIAAKNNVELQRGFSYLKRFKALSRAFASGDFRSGGVNMNPADNGMDVLEVGSWQKLPLYQRIQEANIAHAKMYRDSRTLQEYPVTSRPLPQIKALVYGGRGRSENTSSTQNKPPIPLKVYDQLHPGNGRMINLLSGGVLGKGRPLRSDGAWSNADNTHVPTDAQYPVGTQSSSTTKNALMLAGHQAASATSVPPKTK